MKQFHLISFVLYHCLIVKQVLCQQVLVFNLVKASLFRIVQNRVVVIQILEVISIVKFRLLFLLYLLNDLAIASLFNLIQSRVVVNQNLEVFLGAIFQLLFLLYLLNDLAKANLSNLV